MGNYSTSKVICERTIQFRSHDGCITLFMAFLMFSNQGTISSLLEPYIEKGFVSFRKGDLMKVFKKAHMMFQIKRVGNVYMLQNSEVTVGGLQLSSASKATIMEQSETTMVSSLDVQLYPKERLGLGTQ